MRTFGIEFWLRGLINQEAFIDWSRVIITHDSALLGQPKPLRAVSREEFS